MSRCKWNIKSAVTDEARILSKELGISSIVAQVFINRGYKSKSDIEKFLNPDFSTLIDPFSLLDMEKGARRFAKAIINKEKICIYGDYDIDGATSISLMLLFIKELGINASYYQPSRFDEGYGLHLGSVKKIIEDGVDLIISVDCGSTSFEAANYCKDKGIDLIITDHHKVESEPSAYAFINPQRFSNDNSLIDLAGVGVAYYLIIATRKILRDEGFFKNSEPNLKKYLDIVAFGTIADVVSLTGINRVLVKEGINIINKNPRVCFRALKNSSSIKGLVDEEIISFIYAPKLNAPGRMGNSSCVVDLILTDDEKEADSIIKKLELDNKERIKYQSKAWNDVCKIVENLDLSKFNALTFASSDWHQGIIGIIASKAVDAWRKPTAVFSISSDGTAKGSIRSIDGVNVFNILSNLKNILEDFGGHEMAAGLSIKTEKIDEFKILFENEVKSVDALPPVLDIDVEVDIADMCINIVDQISSMSPFGSNNPKPTFVSKNIKILNKWIVKEKHLKLKFQNGDEAIGFNMSQMESGILNNINMVFSPTINDWNGKLQYRIIDIE